MTQRETADLRAYDDVRAAIRTVLERRRAIVSIPDGTLAWDALAVDVWKELRAATPSPAPSDRLPPDHPRTYSLVGSPHLFLVTDDESGITLGYADLIGGPLVAPSVAATPSPAPSDGLRAALASARPSVTRDENPAYVEGWNDAMDYAEHAALSAPVQGLDPDVLARALQRLDTPVGAYWPPIQPFHDRATAIAAEYARLTPQPPAGTPVSLDAAWRAAEAALPEGWRPVSLGPTDPDATDTAGNAITEPWTASICSASFFEGETDSDAEFEVGSGPTPTAALQALAVRLADQPKGAE